jgi:uncharacterized protein DUF4062
LNTPHAPLRRDIRIFISAVSRELGTVRKLVKKALEDSGYHVVEQDNFPLDYRDVREKLYNLLASCDAVIHIAGQCFGAAPPLQPEGMTCRSYTQLEYDLAHDLRKPVYVFITDEAFLTDPYAAEDEEHSRLQAAHRQALMQTGRDYCRAIFHEDIDQKVRSLPLKEEILTAELTWTDDRVVTTGRRLGWRLALILVLVLPILGMVSYLVWQSGQQQQNAQVTVEFKSSPLFTAQRQKHIRRDLTAFHDYLTAIGFDIPKKVPFILGTTPNRVSMGLATPGDPYNTFIRIPENTIHQDRRIQIQYAMFVFRNLFTRYEPFRSKFYLGGTLVFSVYYVSSYRGINFCSETDTWCQALWDIRQQYGQAFTDKLLFYEFQQWEQASPSESNFDAYFMYRFFKGLSVAANDVDQQAPAVMAILRKRGLDPEQLPP